MGKLDDEVLCSVLRPLAYWYEQEKVEEVAINHPGDIWLRLRGKRAFPWVNYKDPKLSREYLTNLLHIIANLNDQEFDPINGSPVVYARIPGGHRFTGVAGKNIEYDLDDSATGGIAITIRLHTDDVAFGFGDYGLEQGKRLKEINPLKNIKDPDDAYERLLLALRRGDHILVSGGTGTGKTTLLNNLLKLLDIHKRVITVEDTRELNVPQPNHVHIVLSRTEQTNSMDYSKVIDLIVRFTPDAIIGGEISTSNAAAIWELMGSGHDNCLATIHAESSTAAYEAFVKRIMRTQPHIDVEKTIEEMRRKLHVVQIVRDGNIRGITEIT